MRDTGRVSRLQLDVLAYVALPLQANLRVALCAHHALTLADGWRTLEAGARSGAHDVLIADPNADGAERVAELASLLTSAPWTPLVIYTAVSPTSLRAVAELSTIAAPPVVLFRYDDAPSRLLETIERQPGHALSGALLRRLAPGLGRLTPSLARAVERLVRRPTGFDTAADLAAAAQVTVRTVYRQLGAAGFGSPREMIVGARLLRAYACARDPAQSLEDVAERLGYSAPRMLTRHMRELVGVTPRLARRRMAAEEFVDALAAKLYPASAASPGSAVGPVRAASRSVS